MGNEAKEKAIAYSEELSKFFCDYLGRISTLEITKNRIAATFPEIGNSTGRTPKDVYADAAAYVLKDFIDRWTFHGHTEKFMVNGGCYGCAHFERIVYFKHNTLQCNYYSQTKSLSEADAFCGCIHFIWKKYPKESGYKLVGGGPLEEISAIAGQMQKEMEYDERKKAYVDFCNQRVKGV